MYADQIVLHICLLYIAVDIQCAASKTVISPTGASWNRFKSSSSKCIMVWNIDSQISIVTASVDDSSAPLDDQHYEELQRYVTAQTYSLCFIQKSRTQHLSKGPSQVVLNAMI